MNDDDSVISFPVALSSFLHFLFVHFIISLTMHRPVSMQQQQDEEVARIRGGRDVDGVNDRKRTG